MLRILHFLIAVSRSFSSFKDPMLSSFSPPDSSRRSITGSLVQRNFGTVLFVEISGFARLAVLGVNVSVCEKLSCEQYLFIDIPNFAFGIFQRLLGIGNFRFFLV